MASTIKLKSSTTAGNAPSSLETGEFAINVKDGNLFYGSSSAVKQHFIVDELEVKGNLTAQQYIVSSSVVYTTQSFSSGSTAFGDSADDTHVFTGNITASSNISASGTITATSFTGNGSALTSLPSQTDNNFTTTLKNKLDAIEASADVTDTTNVTAAGALMDSELAEIATVKALTKAGVSGSFNAASASFSTRVTANDAKLTANTSNVTAAGALMDSELSDLAAVKAINQGLTTTSNVQFANITGSIISASGDIISNNLEVSNNITAVSASIPGVIVGNTNLLSLGDADGNVGAVRATINQNGTTSFNGNTTLKVYGNIIKLNKDAEDNTARIELSGPVTASGDISASGVLTGYQLSVNGVTEVSHNGRIYPNYVNSTNNFIDATADSIKINGGSLEVAGAGHITASGDISASGDILGNHYKIDGNSLANTSGTTTLSIGAASFYDRINLGKFNSTTVQVFLPGQVTASGDISASGNLLGTRGQFSSQVEVNGEVALSTTDSATTGLVFADTQITKIKIGKAGSITSTLLESNVTASGDISASGTIFTDTLSSPSNDLQIPSDTVTITAGTAGDANLILHADTDNNDENDNPYMYYKQDGDGGVFGIIGLSGANDKWPDGTTLTGATANGMVIGMTGSASGTARQVTIAAGNSASIIVKNDADVQILESLIVDNDITATGGTSNFDVIVSKTNKLSKTSTVDGNHQGDVVFFGGTTSMDVGQIYNLNGAGGWTKAQANSQANSDALLAVALGAASDTNGMLLKGMVTLDHDPGTIGDPLYLSDSAAGQATSTAPNSTNDIVRLIGYCVDSTNGQIYFNPSNDFIKHA